MDFSLVLEISSAIMRTRLVYKGAVAAHDILPGTQGILSALGGQSSHCLPSSPVVRFSSETMFPVNETLLYLVTAALTLSIAALAIDEFKFINSSSWIQIHQ